MRKPPKDFKAPKKDEPDPKDPKKELYDLVWYDSLVEANNRVEAPSPPKRILGERKNTMDPNMGFSDKRPESPESDEGQGVSN